MITLARLRSRSGRLFLAVRTSLASAILALQHHAYSAYDLQYALLLFLFAFCFVLVDRSIWLKLPIALAALACLVSARTRPFMLPFLAIAGWLVLFYSCRFIPANWRPHIYTSVLVALDNIIYGGNLSDLLASSTSPWKDLLAWLSYGIFHFVMPFVVAILIALFAPAGTLPVFARTFGYMNLAGVLTQLLFPCAPPWYESLYGPLQPAAYSMPGDPGGLARVDDILGTDMYRTTFTASPLVFGAFPSLHSGCAWQLAFFIVFIFGPRSIPIALLYVMWIWWAAMYLGHHYMIDLVAGGIYAVVAFWIGSSFLPPVLSYGGTHAISKENHLFFDAPEYTIVGRSEDREQWAEDSDNEATESSSDTLVVDMNNEMDMISSMESITATDRMLDTKIWTRWQGYEGWAVALRSARLGQPVLQNSLDASYEFTSKQIFNTSPQESRKDLDRCDVIHPQDVVDLETVGQATNDAFSGGSGPSLLRGGPVAPPTSRQIVLDRGMAPNLAISAATNGTADDGTKRMSRSAHLSISESSSGAASGWSSPTSPSRTVFSEAEIAASLEVSVDSSVDASPDVLTTASVTLGLIAPTTPVAATMAKVIPSANAGKRLKDD